MALRTAWYTFAEVIRSSFLMVLFGEKVTCFRSRGVISWHGLRVNRTA
jgi:hypothetical protein